MNITYCDICGKDITTTEGSGWDLYLNLRHGPSYKIRPSPVKKAHNLEVCTKCAAQIEDNILRWQKQKQVSVADKEKSVVTENTSKKEGQ